MYAQIWCESDAPENGDNCDPIIVDVVLEKLRFGVIPQSMVAILLLIGIVITGYLFLGLPMLKRFLMPASLSLTAKKEQ